MEGCQKKQFSDRMHPEINWVSKIIANSALLSPVFSHLNYMGERVR